MPGTDTAIEQSKKEMTDNVARFKVLRCSRNLSMLCCCLAPWLLFSWPPILWIPSWVSFLDVSFFFSLFFPVFFFPYLRFLLFFFSWPLWDSTLDGSFFGTKLVGISVWSFLQQHDGYVTSFFFSALPQFVRFVWVITFWYPVRLALRCDHRAVPL